MAATLPALIGGLEAKLKSTNTTFQKIRLGEALYDAYHSYYLQIEPAHLEEKILNDLYRQWPDLIDFEGDLKIVVRELIKEQADQ